MLAGLALGLCLTATSAADLTVIVRNGRLKKASDVTESWSYGDGFVEGTARGNDLFAGHGIGEGDFHVTARLRIKGIEKSAAAFRMGPSYFGFEGATGETFLNGPMFNTKLSFLGPAREHVPANTWFRFEAIRENGDIRFLIDGREIHSVHYEAGGLAPVGFVPTRSTMQISDFWLEAESMTDYAPMPAGYTIPTIDLNDDAHRQVTVDREAGQYLGHPTTVLLADNTTMIIVYPKGHGRGAIVMKKSFDAGLTWTDRLPVPETWATSLEVPTIYPTVDASGKKRLIMFSGLYPIRMAVSEDDGETWSELEPIGDFGGIVAMADCFSLSDGPGRYMAVFHDDGRFLKGEGKVTRFQVFATISEDGGVTWGDPFVIAEHASAHICEPGMVRSPDGNQICLLLRENSRQMNAFVIFSDDEGQTWSEPRQLPAALTGDRHQAVYAPDGRLVISFRDTTLVSPTKGDWVAWIGTYEDIARGREGQYRVRLKDNTKGADCSYPAMEILPDGTIIATTYGHWAEGEEPYILSVRFKVEEIDDVAAAD